MLSPLPPSSGRTLRPTTVNEKTRWRLQFFRMMENPNNFVCKACDRAQVRFAREASVGGSWKKETSQKPMSPSRHLGSCLVGSSSPLKPFFRRPGAWHAEEVPYNKWMFYDVLWFSDTNPMGRRLRITFWCGPTVSKSPIQHILAPKKNCWELRMSTPWAELHEASRHPLIGSHSQALVTTE